MKKMKLLPLGVQTFLKIRSNDYVYVDKTEHIYRLAVNGGVYFLSRPRRFGKSLTVSTLRELFEGNRLLFKDLWIEDKWDWSQTNPVIHLSFSLMGYQGLGLARAIDKELSEIAASHNIAFSENDYKIQFKELINGLYQKYGKVVILIDEYDKPIIDYLEKGELPQAKINQKIMKNFYSVLKNTGDDVRFLFITGISKFSKISLFSDLNNLTDLMLEPDYAAIVGYTQEELLFYFGDYLDATAQKLKISREELLEHIKVWYNGFSWDGQTKVYNPFGTLRFLSQKQFMSHWFITGMPSFLMRLMKNRIQFNVENTRINSLELEKYDIDNLDIIPLLFQTGYLTVKSLDPMTGSMVLDYPNKEVREGMYQFMIDGIATDRKGDVNASNSLEILLKAFAEADLDTVKATINALLAGLPSEAYDKKSEGLYHGLLHFIFKLLGIYIKSEVHSSRGRADSVVETATHIYIFEFKFNKTAAEAMQQIKTKKYAAKYQTMGKNIVGIGVNFKTDDREINEWEVEIF